MPRLSQIGKRAENLRYRKMAPTIFRTVHGIPKFLSRVFERGTDVRCSVASLIPSSEAIPRKESPWIQKRPAAS
jgi:hypothetical protein